MKRFMSIVLAVVMAFAFQATAFAAAPANMDGPGGIILPRAALYPRSPIAGTGSVRTTAFTATPSNGNYIRVWYENNATSEVMVYLYRTDSGKLTVAARFRVGGNGGQGHDNYNTSTAGRGTGGRADGIPGGRPARPAGKHRGPSTGQGGPGAETAQSSPGRACGGPVRGLPGSRSAGSDGF